MIRLEQGPVPQILNDNEAAWTAEYLAWASDRMEPEPRRYAHPEIRAALEAETAAKCAYCEGRINDVAYTNIEHKLPKRHYPALVCRWDNLTIGCPRCNTLKGDYADPDCPLLDPYVDDVEEHVVFWGPMALPRGGPQAQITLRRLDLNRMELLFARGQTIQQIDMLLDAIGRSTDIALVKSLWAEVDAYTSGRSEFASACRYFVKAQTDERGLQRPD